MSFVDAFGSVRAQVAAFFYPRRRSLSRKSRRLVREQLERRCVLSVAPLEVESDVPSLESYIAAEPEMGPVEPTADEAADDGNVPPEAVDQYFSDGTGEGEGESEDEMWTGGDGSGGEGEGDEPWTGDGEEGGSGDGGGEGEGEEDDEVWTGGGGEENVAPTITFELQFDSEDPNYLILVGSVMDDGLLELCAVEFGDLITDVVQVQANGHFELRILRPENAGTITATANDGELYSETLTRYFDPQ